MPSGTPNSGPFSGKGVQHKTYTDPASGRTYNLHYYLYTLLPKLLGKK